MWDKIMNPKTGRFVKVYGTVGKKILKQYLKVLSGGGILDKFENQYGLVTSEQREREKARRETYQQNQQKEKRLKEIADKDHKKWTEYRDIMINAGYTAHPDGSVDRNGYPKFVKPNDLIRNGWEKNNDGKWERKENLII